MAITLEPAIHPACLPITSRIKTLVDDSAIDSTSKEASIVELTTYFATDPNPGQQSVTAKSLSTVFGIAIHLRSKFNALQALYIFRAVSAESFPPL